MVRSEISSARIAILALFPLLAYFCSWYYNGQYIPLLAGSTIILLLWGAFGLWPRIRAGFPWPRGFLPLFMLAWLVWFWLTLFWSHVPYSSWFYFWTLGSLPLAFLIGSLLQPVEAHLAWQWFWRGILLTSWVLVGIAFWEYFHGIATDQPIGNLRVQGTLLDTNSFAAWMNLIWFVLLGRFLYLEGQRSDRLLIQRLHRQAFFYLVTLLFVTFAFWATYSRGGVLAWVCTFVVALFAFRKTHGFVHSVALVLGIEIAGYLIFGYLHHYNMFGHLAPGYISSNINTVSRGLMWIATWHIFLAHPYLGTGLGSYFLFYPEYRLPAELASAGTYAHNDYIEFLAEGGLINLGFLLAFAGTLMYALYRLIFRAARLGISEESRYWALGLVLGVFAITGHALGNFIFYNLPLSILAGLFLAQAWRLYQQPEETAPILPRLGFRHFGVAQLLMVLVFVAAAWFLLLDAGVYLLFSDNAWLSSVITQPNVRAIFLMRAARFLEVARPQATQPWVYMGNAYQNLAAEAKTMPDAQRKVLLDAALQQYRKSLVGIPRQSGVYNAIGNVYSSQWQVLGLSHKEALDMALLAWRRGLAIDPSSVNLRSEIASNAFFDRGNVHGGLAFLKDGLKRPLFPEPRALLQWVIASDEWHLAHDPKAAERILIRSLHANPGFAPSIQLLREIVASTGSAKP
ncbi:O-antigen ligase family protein [Acidithiobacillus ferridurans]|uniref:O-antigen ligase family protein n=1 Tax=Acidithiobacillus ferridurans TaxID=1232575 RepID=UPI001C07C936|nr:O-antigen ligase family protein [Acidithiobacillus ferridurans]MBU2806134.1 O-antigen ligase family protein [Acidithiobacillus ferridurans]